MKTLLTENGLIEIPEIFRRADALQTGARCEVERVGRNEYRVVVEAQQDAGTEDWVDVLLACPAKDWFQPMERTETTDDLKPNYFG